VNRPILVVEAPRQFYCPYCDKQVYTTIHNVKINDERQKVRCCISCNEILDFVPAPRLVGIEPNPGPSDEIKIDLVSNPRSFKSNRRNRKTKRKSRQNGTIAKIFSMAGQIPYIRTETNLKNYKITRSNEVSALLTQSTTLPVFTATSFQLSDLPDYTEFTALFDKYRITSIEAWLFPRNTQTATGSNGLITSVIDYDDATALSTVSQAMEYQNQSTAPGNCGHYRRFTPAISLAAYSGAFTSYAQRQNQWIDSASPSVQHYGYKLASTVATTAFVYDAIFKYHIEFQQTH